MNAAVLWRRMIALSFVVGMALRTTSAQNEGAVNQITYEGILGPARIGLTLLVKGSTITGGHYFYAKYLTDIPLTGTIHGSDLALKGQDGGAFTLKFTGNGSDGGKQLDFNNSVGLAGSWSKAETKDGKALPVKLGAAGQSGISASARRYEMVTDESDAAFEATVQSFYRAALAGDKTAAARYVDFPLRINQGGKSRMVRSAADLSAQWERIFTPAYIAALQRDMPHDLSVIQGQAMLGAGDAFFTAKGASALNVP